MKIFLVFYDRVPGNKVLKRRDMVAELLLEIGSEEIPAGYLEGGLKDLQSLTKKAFETNRIELAGGIYTYGTPRRLVLIGKAIAETQQDLVQEITGPPLRVAYDGEGRPTKAASGFAKKQGVTVDDLKSIKTEKGEYLYLKRTISGRPTREILSEILPVIIAAVTWPKSMRWGSVGAPFVRPVHWIVGLFNGEVLPFEFAGITSGAVSRGHRFMAPELFEVCGVDDYMKQIERSFVVLEQAERERIILDITTKEAGKVEGTLPEDSDLVSTVANLVEYPSAVCGGFDSKFLSLPDPVLITAMRKHQKYFAVRDREGSLLPNFVAVNNTLTRDTSIVRKGHERVLRARLSDAAFFMDEDRKQPLMDRLENLKRVIYQADLGTSLAKVQRFENLSKELAEMVLSGEVEDVALAARLCKCDLITQMVGEFPSLQGVMGREYAQLEGYPDKVSAAIEEHYLPLKAGGELPGSVIGAVVGVADRMDTIAGCFAVGLEPTGSADPFALRRHAIAIIRIIETMGWGISLSWLVDRALFQLKQEIDFPVRKASAGVIAFVRERYKNLLLGEGYEPDLIEAVLAGGFDKIHQFRPRIEQLKRFADESNDFSLLAFTFKRVTNILKKEKDAFPVDTSLFQDHEESALWETFEDVRGSVSEMLEGGRFFQALERMAELRKPVDLFFDNVEVMVKDNEVLRKNRIGLLQQVEALVLLVADFSKFSI